MDTARRGNPPIQLQLWGKSDKKNKIKSRSEDIYTYIGQASGSKYHGIFFNKVEKPLIY